MYSSRKDLFQYVGVKLVIVEAVTLVTKETQLIRVTKATEVTWITNVNDITAVTIVRFFSLYNMPEYFQQVGNKAKFIKCSLLSILHHLNNDSFTPSY